MMRAIVGICHIRLLMWTACASSGMKQVAGLPPEEQQMQKCPECHRLWAEYVSALFHYASVDRQLYFTSLGEQPGSIETLSGSFIAATTAKDSMREMIRRHKETHRRAEAATA